MFEPAAGIFDENKQSTYWNFQVCPRKQLWFWIPALQLGTYWKNTERTFASLSKKCMRRRKRKVIGVIKHNTLRGKCKDLQIFLKTKSKLIPCDLLEILEGTLPLISRNIDR